MSDKLKKFVTDHRQEFETNEPGKDLWDKIDAGMVTKNAPGISSHWLSKLKYLAFGASILVVAVYFIAKRLKNSSENGLTPEGKEATLNRSDRNFKGLSVKSGLSSGKSNHTQKTNGAPSDKNRLLQRLPASVNNKQHAIARIHAPDLRLEKDTALNLRVPENNNTAHGKTTRDSSTGDFTKSSNEINSFSLREKKENKRARNNKKTELYLPEEPRELDRYTGTLYESSSLCSLLRVYTFPGKVGFGDGDLKIPRDYKLNLRITSCSRLESMTTIKAVWLKGKTDNKIILSLKDGFKNIVLLKPDGRKFCPVGVSHYYPGRGVISGYRGRRFSMVFKRKMELILFFREAEAGDRILINGTIEAIVEAQP